MYAYRGKCAHCREQKIFILFFIFFKLFAKMVLQYEYSATFSNKYEAKFRKKCYEGKFAEYGAKNLAIYSITH